jgi:hypothetical protein
VAITTRGMKGFSQKRMLKWISHYHGFGTLIHINKGNLTEETYLASKRIEKRLVGEMEGHGANYTVKTIVSPSMLTGVAQTVQLTGISGIDSNTIMFEFNDKRRNELPEILEGLKVAGLASYNKLVLRTTEHHFGTMRSIHLWIRPNEMNLNMMIMLAYIIMQNREWKDSSIMIFALRSRDQENRCENFITSLINERRIPFPRSSIHPVYFKDEHDIISKVNELSSRADLTMIGFNKKEMEEMGSITFTRFDKVQETLFVNAVQDITII